MKLKLGRYTVGDKLGSGGFGVVYGGRSKDEKEFAIKILEATSDDQAIRRFKREVRIQSQLDHPNVVPIVDFDLDADPPWFAMPLAKSNLRDKLADLKEESEIIGIFTQILAGVQHAHSKEIIHRDLKPENVLFFAKDQVAISDFGLGTRMTKDTTTITQTNVGIGTIAYSAPEQYVSPKDPHVCCDIYALGKILYEMLSHKLPFPDLELSALPGKFQYIVRRCVRPKPAERFQSVRQLLSELKLLEREEEFELPLEKARKVLEEILALDPALKNDMKKLKEILEREADDASIYMQVLPRLTGPTLKAFAEKYPTHFKESIEQFDQHVSGSLGFAYTDLVADLYAGAFDLIDDVGFRQMLISRLLRMGHSHNRFHVRDVFWRLVCKAEDKGLALAVVNLVRENREAAEWMAERMNRHNLPPIIEKAFKNSLKESH